MTLKCKWCTWKLLVYLLPSAGYVNISQLLSPAKLNSSLNSSTNSIGARSHSSMSRLPSSSRKSSVVTRNPEPPVSKRTSISTQGRRASELLPRPVKATPLKKTDPLPPPQLQTPAKNTVEKPTTTSSIPTSAAKMGSALRGNPKLKVPVVPTPKNSLKRVHKSEGEKNKVMLMDRMNLTKPVKENVFIFSICKMKPLKTFFVYKLPLS